MFTYLDAFDSDREALAGLKAHYQRGGLGDVTVKRRLAAVLREIIGSIRERRKSLESDPKHVLEICAAGRLTPAM